MKKVYIKYNPYNLETEIFVDDVPLAENSSISEKIAGGARLQEWIEDLPRILIDEYNDKDFQIKFKGTLSDYEDLTYSFQEAYKEGIDIGAEFDREPAKETKDKEKLIDNVFEKIQNGPFPALKDPAIINAFQNAKNSDFEVCVIATMSAGKSTLINSMLGKKLMPSSQEACTAIITKIKDNDTPQWQAEVIDKNQNKIAEFDDITYEDMDSLNKNTGVSTIKINGDIPFVKADEISLVLIDTPGPNNSRDPEHKKVQYQFLNESSKSLVLYIMEGTFGTDDDNALLQRVAESMRVGGKQSKDRFIFVVNKMDGRKKEDGSTAETLDRVRNYLQSHGIINPNLFPAAALPALNIKQIQNNIPMDDDDIDETDVMVKKLNRNEELHLEEFASLPASIKKEVAAKLTNTNTDKQDLYNQNDALIHTGIPSIEAAIRQYVEKYAKTAKIKNIVDTFMHKVEELKCYETMTKEIAENQEKAGAIVNKIDKIRKNIDDIDNTAKFQEEISRNLNITIENSQNVIERILVEYQKTIRETINNSKGRELSINMINFTVQSLTMFASNLQPQFETQLDDLINKSLVETCNNLLDNYKKRLSSFTEELGIDGIEINPLKLISGSIPNIDINTLVREKQVAVGEEWVENTDKRWYKPWTWFDEAGYYRTKYESQKFVDSGELAQTFLTPIQKQIIENANAAKNHAKNECEKIVKHFNAEFNRLDHILKEKMNELEKCATDRDTAERKIKDATEKLAWLEGIKKEINSILEI